MERVRVSHSDVESQRPMRKAWTADDRSYEVGRDSFVGALAKKLGPWILLGTVFVGIAAWLFAAGVKTESFALKADVTKGQQAELAAQFDMVKQLAALNERLASMEAKQTAQGNDIGEIRKDVRELRSTAGVRVTSPGAKGP